MVIKARPEQTHNAWLDYWLLLNNTILYQVYHYHIGHRKRKRSWCNRYRSYYTNVSWSEERLWNISPRTYAAVIIHRRKAGSPIRRHYAGYGGRESRTHYADRPRAPHFLQIVVNDNIRYLVSNIQSLISESERKSDKLLSDPENKSYHTIIEVNEARRPHTCSRPCASEEISERTKSTKSWAIFQ